MGSWRNEFVNTDLGALIAVADQGRSTPLQDVEADVYSITTYSGSTADFHDITSGSNGYQAKAGYDYVTGIGSPVASKLIPELTALTASSSATPAGLTGGSTLAVQRAADSSDGMSITAIGATPRAPLASDLASRTADLPIVATAATAMSDFTAMRTENGGADGLLLAETPTPVVMSFSFAQSVAGIPAGLAAAEADTQLVAAQATDYLLQHGAAAATVFGDSPLPGSHAWRGNESVRAADWLFGQTSDAISASRTESSATETRATDKFATFVPIAGGGDSNAEARTWSAALAVFAWYATKDIRGPRDERKSRPISAFL